MTATGAFRVVAVCTGNVCRSPAVERLLAGRLGPAVDVASAGTRPLTGSAISAPMISLLGSVGARTDDFMAQGLTEAMLAEADLVLALAREHRSAVVTLYPAATSHTFTLRELARLLALVEPERMESLARLPVSERLRALVPLAREQRGRTGAVAHEPDDDDVVDPWGGDMAVYRQAFGQILPAVDVIVDVALGRLGTPAT